MQDTNHEEMEQRKNKYRANRASPVFLDGFKPLHLTRKTNPQQLYYHYYGSARSTPSS